MPQPHCILQPLLVSLVSVSLSVQACARNTQNNSSPLSGLSVLLVTSLI